MSNLPTPSAADMFSDATSNTEMVERHERFVESIYKSISTPIRNPHGANAQLAQQLGNHRDQLSKGVTQEQLDSVRTAILDGGLSKDWTTTSPLGTGLVGFDLAAPALMLTPHQTPLRNRIARRRGMGLNRQYKRITGFSGTRTGGAAGAPIRPGINESTTHQFGPGNLSYARGPKIQYASDEKIIPYIQSGLSDEVSWAAQYAGLGFDDIRARSSQALLWSSMLSEENMLLGGRGTRSGYAGALAAPTNLTLTKRTAASNEVGASGSIANLFVRVTSVGMWGQSVSSAEATIASITTGQVVDIDLDDAPGALGYRVFVGTTSGAANCFAASASNSSATLNVAPLLAGDPVAGSPITVHFNGGGTGGAPAAVSDNAAPTSDTSAVADEYDGILSWTTGPESGYVKRLNAPLSAAGGPYEANVGGELGDAFASMWDVNRASPDEILASGRDRKQISDLLRTQSSSNYEIMLTSSDVGGATTGSVVNSVYNPVTGKTVALTVHPWLPQGNLPIISWSMPVPDSNVGACWEVSAPADFTLYEWPVNEYYYTASTYWFSALVSYAPAWSGCIQGVFRA